MSSPKHSPEIRERIKALWEAGNSSGIIARLMGAPFTRNSIIGVVARMKLAKRPTDLAKANPSLYKPRPKPVIPPDAAKEVAQLANEPLAVGPLNDIPREGCKWIAGDPQKPDWRCCASPVVVHRPYCSHHAARAYVAPRPQR